MAGAHTLLRRQLEKFFPDAEVLPDGWQPFLSAVEEAYREFDCHRQMVERARKIQKFLSQPNFVAEQFTGKPGRYVSVKDTVKSFKAIIEGNCDSLPEGAFYMCGDIEEVFENAKKMGAKS